MRLLQRLNAEGSTIILVTHEPDVAVHARRILRFRDGRLVDAVPGAGIGAKPRGGAAGEAP
jgi:ABC-type lipoprotein export system ATPase subunit